MKMRLSCAVLLLAASAMCMAAPVTLKCKTDTGTPTPNLVVDLNNHIMSWGGSNYAIRGVTDKYITGIEEGSDHIGAEIFVLDRTTGEYQRAYVLMTMAAIAGGLGPPTLTSNTYRGTCTRPIL